MAANPLAQRTRVALALITVLAVPAGVLRVLCVGNACPETARGPSVPFCSLPGSARSLITAGFREDRSPDVYALSQDSLAAPVPVAFDTAGLEGEVPPGTSLDQVAPTLSALTALSRPHPEVRSGRTLRLAAPPGHKLAVIVVWKGAGSTEAREARTPILDGLIERGAGTMEGEVGSWPPDPTAALATIGTGGIPRQHGLTGDLVRDDDGTLVAPGTRRAPVSIIATLADDLDEQTRERAVIGLVGTDPTDSVAIGGDWYLEGDRDDVRITRPQRVAAVAELMLRSGFGADRITDLLVVVLEGSPERMDSDTGDILGAASDRDPSSIAVVVGTGTSPEPQPVDLPSALEKELGARVTSSVDEWGRIFLDQDVLAEEGIASRDVVAALDRMSRDPSPPTFTDVFAATSIEFGRYC